jgi:hypothetical protein
MVEGVVEVKDMGILTIIIGIITGIGVLVMWDKFENKGDD